MIRRSRTAAAAAIGTLAMAAALAASAGTAAHAAPASIPVVSNPTGEAGLYGADDNHTHYRDVRATVVATLGVTDLNGTSVAGTAGVELCNPNNGATLGIGLWDDSGTFAVSYVPAVGTLAGPAVDPCIQDGLAVPLATAPQLAGPKAPTGVSIAVGDVVYLEAFYGPHGRWSHAIGYAACDETQDWCRQYGSQTFSAQDFWQFGTGAYTPVTNVTGGPVNYVTTFGDAEVTCYSCAGPVPIADVHGWQGLGGLRIAQWANTAGQVQMAPGPLNLDTFALYEGSVSP